jgi:ABC-type Fe3+/spermidine/putrescine transport system ATPase subunit
MSTTLRCTDLRKVYPGHDVYALGSPDAGVSFEVERGELFALLGPSGCGKTTTLRIVGGFVDATAGRVEIDGADVTHKPPYNRPTNTVFQSYALFPHMRLAANVAYGLKMDGVGKAEREARASEALELVGLGGMERRRISELSGGQQQRAALARAIVKRPAVLLLDEPLGALDLKLRRQMQDELVTLKRSTGTTFIHVTHDQEEACAIADRIAVMDQGMIVQVDEPQALYRAPRTAYVASFIDAGTIIRGRATRRDDVVEIVTDDLVVTARAPGHLSPGTAMAAVLPHERVRLSPQAEAGGAPNRTSGTIDRVVFTGSVFNVHVRVGDGRDIRAAVAVDDAARLGADGLEAGRAVGLSWDAEDVAVVEDDQARTAGRRDSAPAPTAGAAA